MASGALMASGGSAGALRWPILPQGSTAMKVTSCGSCFGTVSYWLASLAFWFFCRRKFPFLRTLLANNGRNNHRDLLTGSGMGRKEQQTRAQPWDETGDIFGRYFACRSGAVLRTRQLA